MKRTFKPSEGDQGRLAKEVELVLNSELPIKGRPRMDEWWSKPEIGKECMGQARYWKVEVFETVGN